MYQEEFSSSSPAAGTLCDSDAAHCTPSVDEQYFDSYGDMSVHRLMLQDRPRMEFYHAALSDRSRIKGKVLADIGAGTGILSMWGVCHGNARHCFAFEASPLSSVLRQIASDNGVGDEHLTVIARRVEAVIAEGVDTFIDSNRWLLTEGGIDVVVSEWMGFYLVHECMLPSVVAARDFFQQVNDAIASRNGTTNVKTLSMIPDTAAIYAAPVNLNALRSLGYESVYNSAVNHPTAVDTPLNFSFLGKLDYETKMSMAVNPLIDVVPPACLLTDAQKILTWDLSTVSSAETLSLESMTAEFHFKKTPQYDPDVVGLHGFVLWFDVSTSSHAADHQADGNRSPLTLTTSPHAPPTHWKQCVLLLDAESGWASDDLLIPHGTRMHARFAAVCDDVRTRQYTLTVELH